jgi:molybdenum cofactor biosynthesis protein B
MNVLTPGGRINESQPIKAGADRVLTISDTRDDESDTSGHVLAERVKAAGHELADKAIVRDNITEIREKIQGWVAHLASSRRSSPPAAPASPAAT